VPTSRIPAKIRTIDDGGQIVDLTFMVQLSAHRDSGSLNRLKLKAIYRR
jgi:hypothetical protein